MQSKIMRFSCSILPGTYAPGTQELDVLSSTLPRTLSASISRSSTLKRTSGNVSHNGNWRWQKRRGVSKTKVGVSERMEQDFGAGESLPLCGIRTAYWSASEK